MSMELKAQWSAFKASEPGHRFEERYQRRHAIKRNRFNWSQVLHIGAGGVALLVGLLMMVGPGPGSLFILLGFALLGSEFLPLARAMDWAEMKTLRPVRWVRHRWEHMPRHMRRLFIGACAVMAAGCSFGFYKLLFAN